MSAMGRKPTVRFGCPLLRPECPLGAESGRSEQVIGGPAMLVLLPQLRPKVEYSSIAEYDQEQHKREDYCRQPRLKTRVGWKRRIGTVRANAPAGKDLTAGRVHAPPEEAGQPISLLQFLA
jgi:hypothetical protein